MRHLQTVSYRFIGILYSRRLILLYCNHLEGRQTIENHLVHMGTRRMHIMTSSISILVHFFFLPAKIVKICTQQKFPAIYGNMRPKSENAKRHHRWWYRMKVKSRQSLRIRASGLSYDNQPSIDTCSTNIRELVDSLYLSYLECSLPSNTSL